MVDVLLIFWVPMHAACSIFIFCLVAEECRVREQKAPVRAVLWVIGGPITVLASAICNIVDRIDWRRF